MTLETFDGWAGQRNQQGSRPSTSATGLGLAVGWCRGIPPAAKLPEPHIGRARPVSLPPHVFTSLLRRTTNRYCISHQYHNHNHGVHFTCTLYRSLVNSIRPCRLATAAQLVIDHRHNLLLSSTRTAFSYSETSHFVARNQQFIVFDEKQVVAVYMHLKTRSIHVVDDTRFCSSEAPEQKRQ